jgi:hypothetical protein
MLYSLTDKLSFEDNPMIEINGEVIHVKADAMTVLQLMDVVSKKGEVEGAVEATKLLFSEADREKLSAMNLSMKDYIVVVSTAITLAVGEDPDDMTEGE